MSPYISLVYLWCEGAFLELLQSVIEGCTPRRRLLLMQFHLLGLAQLPQAFMSAHLVFAIKVLNRLRMRRLVDKRFKGALTERISFLSRLIVSNFSILDLLLL